MRILKVYLFEANRSDNGLFHHYSHNKHAAVIQTQKYKMVSVIGFYFKSSIKLDLRKADVDLANFDFFYLFIYFFKQVSTSALAVTIGVKLCQCITKNHATQMYGKVDVKLHSFLTQAPDL
jgi:hypothetical protein